MNKAFVREPEPDVQLDFRAKLGDAAWFCGFGNCEVTYFDLFERVVLVSELRHPIYPKDISAAICPCFGFSLDDVEAAIKERSPLKIRELLAKSKSKEANCCTLAPNGQCCLQEVQRLYIRGVGTTS